MQVSDLVCINGRLPVLILVVPPEAAAFDTWSAHLSLPVRPAHHVHRVRQHDPPTLEQDPRCHPDMLEAVERWVIAQMHPGSPTSSTWPTATSWWMIPRTRPSRPSPLTGLVRGCTCCVTLGPIRASGGTCREMGITTRPTPLLVGHRYATLVASLHEPSAALCTQRTCRGQGGRCAAALLAGDRPLCAEAAQAVHVALIDLMAARIAHTHPHTVLGRHPFLLAPENHRPARRYFVLRPIIGHGAPPRARGAADSRSYPWPAVAPAPRSEKRQYLRHLQMRCR
jgi:hypothetical protein